MPPFACLPFLNTMHEGYTRPHPVTCSLHTRHKPDKWPQTASTHSLPYKLKHLKGVHEVGAGARARSPRSLVHPRLLLGNQSHPPASDNQHARILSYCTVRNCTRGRSQKNAHALLIATTQSLGRTKVRDSRPKEAIGPQTTQVGKVHHWYQTNLRSDLEG